MTPSTACATSGRGRSSARETAARDGRRGPLPARASRRRGFRCAFLRWEIGGMPAPAFTPEDMAGAASRPYCAPCEAAVEPWEALVRTVRGEGDTLDGIVQVEVLGVPSGLGEPVFDKLDAVLAQAHERKGAVKGVGDRRRFRRGPQPGASITTPTVRPGPDRRRAIPRPTIAAVSSAAFRPASRW